MAVNGIRSRGKGPAAEADGRPGNGSSPGRRVAAAGRARPVRRTAPVRRATVIRRAAAVLAAMMLAACAVQAQVPTVVPEVLATYPHATDAFTQGLLMDGERVFESTGLYGSSTLREVELESGAVLRQVDLDERYFGEGLALADERLIMLTWREGEALVFDRDTFEHLETWTYDGEGWGLCFDGDRLVMSNGGNLLTFRSADDFSVLGTVAVTYNGQPVFQLNELECVGGLVYANVWLQDVIVVIDPGDGRVVTLVDARRLLSAEQRAELSSDAVLNGIAWRESTGTFLLTGKLWPLMFEVRLD